MATGDDAIAAGMDTVPGTADRRNGYVEINKTRDYIAQRTSTITPIAKGGTGASAAAGARSNLDVPAKGETYLRANNEAVKNDGVGELRIGNIGGGRIRFEIPGYAFSTTLAHLSDADGAASAAASANSNADGRVSKGGDTMTGNLFLPNASAATSSFQVAYVNGDGRVCRGSSSQRYKKYISPFEPQALGDIWPALQRYKMRGDGIAPAETTWRYGYIAEQIAQHPDQERFTVYRDIDGDVVPDSIDFIGLLIAQTAQLHQRDQERETELELAADRIRHLEDRLTALEERA